MKKFLNWLRNIFFSDMEKMSIPEPLPSGNIGVSPYSIVEPHIVIPESTVPISPKPLEQSKIHIWIEQIKKMEGAKSYRNNPGNLRYVGQRYAVNDKGFCKFDTYTHGYEALQMLLINACTGKSKVYNPDMTLYKFQSIFSPDSDGNNSKHYAEVVAKGLGVSPTIQIKQLI